MPKVPPDTLAGIRSAFERYREECEQSPLKPRAVDTYTRYVNMFIRWLDDRFEPGGTLK